MSQELESTVDAAIERLGASNYVPSAFLEMRAARGTVEAMRYLMATREIETGLGTIHNLGLLDCSIEAIVLKFPSEFNKTVREIAEFRLRLMGWKDPDHA
jgi:hypothetical protein